MSIQGKLGEELQAEGYATTSETLKRFPALDSSTLFSWVSKGAVESIKLGRFSWVKIADVQKRVDALEAHKAKMNPAAMLQKRWPKPPPPLTTDAPQMRPLTREEIKECMREVLREFGLVP